MINFLRTAVFSCTFILLVQIAQANELHAPNTAQGNTHQAVVSIAPDQSAYVTLENIDGLAILEGDIVIGDSQSSTQNFFMPNGTSVANQYSLWPDGVVPYEISSSITSQQTIDRILAAVSHWEQKTPLTFVYRSSQNAADYRDYISFISSDGCSSYIGRQGGKQNLWAGSACSTGNLIHEIGHAVGLYHEHVRLDRDDFVTVHWENIKNGKEHNFNSQPATTAWGKYDYGSIMHYGAYSFSKNGKPTLSRLNSFTGYMGQRSTLSDNDIASINTLYGYSLNTAMVTDALAVEPHSEFSLTFSLANQGISDFSASGMVLQIPSNVTFLNYSSATGDINCDLFESELNCVVNTNIKAGTGQVIEASFQAPAMGNPLSFIADFYADNNEERVVANIVVNSENFPPYVDSDQVFIIGLSELESNKTLGQINASDPNQDAITQYDITLGNTLGAFALNRETGELKLTDASLLDSGPSVHTLTIQVFDHELASDPQTIDVQIVEQTTTAGQSNGSMTTSDTSASGGSLGLYFLALLFGLTFTRVPAGVRR